MHAGAVRDQAGRIGYRSHFHHGFGAVHKFDQHARVHVTADGFLGVGVRGCVKVKRIVLAFARTDDAVAHGADKFDQFHAGRRFVPRAQRIDDAKSLCL